MATAVLNHLDFGSVSQLKNALFDIKSTIPAGVTGQFLYNSTTNKFGYYNGSSWVYPNEYTHPSHSAISLNTNGKFIKSLSVNAFGHVTSATEAALAASDIPSLDWSKITTGKPTTLNGYGITDAATSTQLLNAVPNQSTPAANRMLLSTTTNGTSKWSDGTWAGSTQGILQTSAAGVISRVTPTIWGVTFNGGNVTGVPNLYIGTTNVQTSSANQALTGITSITIGDAVISYDDQEHAIKISKKTGTTTDIGLYAEGFLSSFGASSTEGGGSDITGQSIIDALADYTGSDKLPADLIPSGSGGSFSESAMWSALGTDSTNKKISVNFLPTDIAGLRTRVTTLEGIINSTSDSDNIINKWNEVTAFLAGIGESSTLSGMLALKANSSVKVQAGNGLTGGGDLSADRTISLATINGLTTGTYTKVTVDEYGRITAGTTLSASDLPNASTSAFGIVKVTSGNGLSISNGVLSYTVPGATSSVLGGVKVITGTLTGTGSKTAFTATARTTDSIAQVFDSSGNAVLCDISRSGTTFTFTFGSAPASGTTYKYVIIG